MVRKSVLIEIERKFRNKSIQKNSIEILIQIFCTFAKYEIISAKNTMVPFQK